MFAANNLNNHVRAILEKCTNLDHLKQLQSHLITLGHSQTQFYTFKLIRFCINTLHNLAYARLIFNSLTNPNIYLYTAMITAYTTLHHHHSSLLLYRDLAAKARPRPNHFIFPIILKSCPQVVKPYGIEMMHTQIEKLGFGEYPVVQTGLLDVYSRFSDDVYIAKRVFDGMSDRNVVSWTAMISGYMRVGEVGNAFSLFETMSEEDRDTPCWNSMIAGCGQNGLFSEAIWYLRRMVKEEGMNKRNRPSKITVISSLSACGHCGMLQLGKCIHGYIYRNSLGFDSFIMNALIDMYGKCGSLTEAKRVFDKTGKESLTSWNSMINCFALHGQSEAAIGFFEEMVLCKDKVKPDGVTFIGLLNACTHGGLVEQGHRYYNMMTLEYGIELQIEHYGCLIDLLGRAGHFEDAMLVIRGMRIPPDEVVWGSLLNGCKIHGRTDLAEFALRKLIEIDPSNGGYTAMLANLYGEVGKWDEVRRIRKIMVGTHAYKPPGCSWIEVDNQVHQFYSVDKSHPRSEDIYKILECLVDL